MAPSTRREAREWATQILFELDFAARCSVQDADALDLPLVMDDFWEFQLRSRMYDENEDEEAVQAALAEDGWKDRVADARTRAFCESLVRGVIRHLPQIDPLLEDISENWSLDRMGGIERTVLRLGAYEILFGDNDVPRPVAINEAVDVCKFFGMRGSASFVNGILDRIDRGSLQHRDADAADGDNGDDTWSPDA